MEVTKQNNALQLMQQKFPNATGVIVQPQNFEHFNRVLKKNGLEFQSEYPFKKFPLFRAKDLALIYHSAPHSNVLNLISNVDDLMFQGKNSVGVPITEYIRLLIRRDSNKLPIASRGKMQAWINKLLGGEEHGLITVWKCNNEFSQIQYYLKLEGKSAKKCTFFLYLLCNQYGEKCQLRDPPAHQKIQKMTEYNPTA